MVWLTKRVKFGKETKLTRRVKTTIGLKVSFEGALLLKMLQSVFTMYRTLLRNMMTKGVMMARLAMMLTKIRKRTRRAIVTRLTKVVIV